MSWLEKVVSVPDHDRRVMRSGDGVLCLASGLDSDTAYLAFPERHNGTKAVCFDIEY